MINIYILCFGIFQFLTGIFELLFPKLYYPIIRTIVDSKYYFLHGIFLITTGLPLTVYSGSFSTVIFIIGLIIVFTGPVVIFYPDKVRDIFKNNEIMYGFDYIKNTVRVEAVLRIMAGIIMVSGYILSVQ